MSVDKTNPAIRWIVIYPVDSARYPAFEQPETGLQTKLYWNLIIIFIYLS